MENTNKHGLKRHIPDPIKRQVRQECGFGCVVCGNAVAQYEHIDPEFNDAKIHDPKKIAYLCAYCHDNVTRKIWSKTKIIAARNNPITFKNGISKSVFDIDEPFKFKIGSNEFTDCAIFIQIKDERMIYIEPPEEEGAPARFTGSFYDSNNNLILSIYRNEMRGSINVWDMEIEGPRFTIRKKLGEIIFEMIVDPPHTLTITKIDYNYKGRKILLGPNQELYIGSENGWFPPLSRVKMRSFHTAIQIR